MSLNSTQNELENLLDLLQDSEIAYSRNNVIQQQLSEGRKRVTWASHTLAPGDWFRNVSATVTDYRNWIKSGSFSAALFDGALVQLSFDFSHSQLVGHRLLYFPCPFDMDYDIIREFGLVDAIDLYCESGGQEVRLRTPIRFDYDRAIHSATHPYSHFTFQWAHVRVPVFSPISLGHFIRFVFENFYPQMWRVHSFLRDWPCDTLTRTIASEEESRLHLSVRG